MFTLNKFIPSVVAENNFLRASLAFACLSKLNVFNFLVIFLSAVSNRSYLTVTVLFCFESELFLAVDEHTLFLCPVVAE